MNYVELHARSAFSFLRGASQPEALAEEAARLQLPALALCDRDGVYGAARLFGRAGEMNLQAIVGAELTMEDGIVIPVLVATRTGYQNLCRLITQAKLRGTKTHAPVTWAELPEFTDGLLALTGDEEGILRNPEDITATERSLDQLLHAFGRPNVFVEIQRHFLRDEEWHNERIVELARAHRLPLVATNGVSYHRPEARPVLDVFTALRHHTTLDAAGRFLSPNVERHLKSTQEMTQLFADLPEAIANTQRVAERIGFSLKNLGYKFPKYDVPEGHSMDSFLRQLTYEGAAERYGSSLSPRVRRQLERELTLIAELGFSGYFLIVWDLGKFCREQDILMQGRGSAANSAVCYCLKITACDPIKNNLLFERFLSEGRKEWPDIDLDLPSGDRREHVIQEVYRRYGKHGAAMTANVMTYRGRSAMREIGKTLGFTPDLIDRFSSLYANGDFTHTMGLTEQLRQAGLPADHPRTAAAHDLYTQMRGLPRHLGQHSGGMIICQGALSSVVPLENASMPGRVVAQWNKDDCEDLGIVKVDLLGLGMLAAMQETFALCAKKGCPIELYQIPQDDEPTFELLRRADTIGTFQVESRAQMATLPRLSPKEFYDVVIQVAIVRPGPIQGQMVNPYLNRREGKEEEEYFTFDKELRPILERTKGVPLFQEQILSVAMAMADFSGAEAEELRRAISFHRSDERMNKVCVKLQAGMQRKGVPPDIAERLHQAIKSFAAYGFPESHAISFALIAYASCWLKVHHASEFYCGLLNNQPIGFYSSSTLVQDARARGVRVRPVSVLESDCVCTVGPDGSLRLGLCIVRGWDATRAQRIERERARRPFASLDDFRLRVAPSRDGLRALARVGALNGLVDHRRDGLWKVERPIDAGGFSLAEAADLSPLLPMNPAERMKADYAGLGLTTGRHPMALIRDEVPDVVRACDLPDQAHNSIATMAGMVICRQRPGTAKGYVFISLEDETGISNAIVTPELFEKRRLVISQERFLRITGKVQNMRNTLLLKATKIEALPYNLLATPASHDFR